MVANSKPCAAERVVPLADRPEPGWLSPALVFVAVAFLPQLWGFESGSVLAWVTPIALLACICLAIVHAHRPRVVAYRCALPARAPWPHCANCDKPVLPYDRSIIITWKCPFCGVNRLRKKTRQQLSGKDKNHALFDPDF